MSNTIELRKKVIKWGKSAMIAKLEKIASGALKVQEDELSIILEIAHKRQLPVPKQLISENQSNPSEKEKASSPKQEKPAKTSKKKEVKIEEAGMKVEEPKSEKKAKEKMPVAPKVKKSKVESKIIPIETVHGVVVDMCKSDYVRYLIKDESIRSHKQIKELVAEKFGMNLYYSEFDRCRRNVDEKPKKKKREDD